MTMVAVREDVVRAVAKIMGPSCAAAQAIHDFETRTANGENVAFYHEYRVWVVGPVCPMPPHSGDSP